MIARHRGGGRLAAVLAVALAGGAGGARASQGAPTAGDFHSGADLTIDAGRPLHRVVLPPSVHERVLRADLGDVRVLNAGGAPVPHALGTPAIPAVREYGPAALYPLPAEEGTAAQAVVELRVDAADGVERIVIEPAVPGAAGQRRGPRRYVLDLGRREDAVVGLRLGWAEDAPPFVVPAHVEASDDLVRWRSVKRTTTAYLVHEGRRLARRDIGLPPQRARFLRLTLGEAAPGITSVLAARLHCPCPAVLAWLPAEVARGPGDPHRFRFEVPVGMPVEEIRIGLPERNTTVPVQVRSRGPDADDWSRRAEATVYRLAFEGDEVSSPPVALRGRGGGEFELVFDSRGGGIGSGAPSVEFAYRPATLVFLARGAGPYVLAFGSARIAPAGLALRDLVGAGLDDARLAGAVEALPRAAVGPVRTLAGEAALRPVATPAMRRRYVLWTVLCLGVAAVGAVARRVWRDLQSGDLAGEPAGPSPAPQGEAAR